MKHLCLYVALALSLFSLPSHALLIVDSLKNPPLALGYTGFSTNMLELGYNPETDVAHSIKLSLSFREIVDNGDDWDAGTLEFLIFHAMPWGYRELVYGDLDTETITFNVQWAPGEDTCAIWSIDDECEYDPVKSGQFGIAMTNYSSNLAMDEVRWELDVTRITVGESSSAILFIMGMACVGILRRKKYNRAVPNA